MNKLEQRIKKLEAATERKFDLSGCRAVAEMNRIALRNLSRSATAVEIARASAEMVLRGVPNDSPEALDLQRRLDEVLADPRFTGERP